jgi:hypothetical protein
MVALYRCDSEGLGVVLHAAVGALCRVNNPPLSTDNVILSAHTASASARFDPARKRHVGRELALVLEGSWPMSCVNPARCC